ncbi:hypothetical protein EDB84DRAFT_413446 [Lactarius hengduanensis]|nr:hypothetical protein EDB84DRAFT_413446 [Lactarius hengduanensis]
MSAVRRSDRRAARSQLASPYKRPNAQPKKSSWSLSSLFSFLNPLRRTKSSEELKDDLSDEDAQDEKQSSDGSEFGGSRSADVLLQRGRELAQQPQPPRLPQTPLTPTRQLQSVASTLPISGLVPEPAEMISPFKPSTPFESPRLNVPSQSPAEKLETVKQYLRDRSDQPLHHVEYVGLVSLLKDSVQDDDSQPFRFSASPTPSRGTTPAFNVGSPTPSSKQTPRRTLTRNPNGVYKWQGAGSARPRNRHQSPAFGPPRPTPSKIKLSAPEASPHKSETKRRRVDAATEPPIPHVTGESLPLAQPREQTRADSSALSTSSGSSSHTSMNDSSPDKSAAVPATPRLRLSVPPKPTTPAVPSPLRNTWGVGDSSSSSHSSPPSKSSQPTRAANFMAELIKEVTPPKRPDLSNPYQTASPVKPSLQKKPAKKRKAPEEPPKEQEKKDVSHQTIVEATVPMGSKRSRPPPNIGKAPLSKVNGISHPEPPRRSARLKSPSPPRVNANHIATNGQGNEEPEKGDVPTPKRLKVTVEEVVDVDMHSPTSPTNTHPGDAFDPTESQHNAKKATPTTNGGATPKPPFPLKSSAPKEPSKLRFGFAAESDPDSPPPAKSVFDRPPPAPVMPDELFASLPGRKPQPQPPVIPIRLPPAPSAPVPSSSTGPQSAKSVPKDAKEAALSLDSASLPSFSFDAPMDSQTASKQHDKERSAASAAGPSSLPTFSFVLGARSAAPGAFNWEAAGVKPPTKATGSWTCGVCMVSNDGSKAKCAACEEPRPDSMTNGVTAAAPATNGGFNWAAAGMKMPTKAPGTWSCKVCMVDNDAARVKCASCEEPKSSAPSAVPEPPKPVAPPSGGFDWAAAGMEVPTKAAGTWTCKVCMVDNDPTKAKCVSCEEPRA